MYTLKAIGIMALAFIPIATIDTWAQWPITRFVILPIGALAFLYLFIFVTNELLKGSK